MNVSLAKLACQLFERRDIAISLDMSTKVIDQAYAILNSNEPKSIPQLTLKLNDFYDKHQKIQYHKIKLFVFSEPRKVVRIYIQPKEKTLEPPIRGAFKAKVSCFLLTIDFEKTELVFKQMAKVFPVYDKLLNLSPEDRAREYRDLRNEIAILDQFKGKPEFSQIYNSLEYEGKTLGQMVHKIVMFMEDYTCDLHTHFQVHQVPVSFQEALQYSKTILTAIKYMAQKKYVHRDIKLENIFLSDQMKVALGDFGSIVKIQTEVEKQALTPFYGVPEDYFPPYLTGKANYPADVWGFGIVMREIFKKPAPISSCLIEFECSIEKYVWKFEGLIQALAGSDVPSLGNISDEVSAFLKSFHESLAQLEIEKKLFDGNHTLHRFEDFFSVDFSERVKTLSKDFFAHIQYIKEWVDNPDVVETFSDQLMLVCKDVLSSLVEIKKSIREKLTEVFEDLERINQHAPYPQIITVDNGIDVLSRKIFVVNPDKRITASKALKLIEKLISSK